MKFQPLSKPVILLNVYQYYLTSINQYYYPVLTYSNFKLTNYSLENIYIFARIPAVNGCLWIFWKNVSTHHENLMCFLYFPSFLWFNNIASLNQLDFSQVLFLYRKNVAKTKQCLQFLCNINFNATSVFLFHIFPL